MLSVDVAVSVDDWLFSLVGSLKLNLFCSYHTYFYIYVTTVSSILVLVLSAFNARQKVKC